MGTEVEKAAGDIQTAVTNPSSTASINGPKTSMFAKRSGFVIPKNKLSGSLVPIFRGTKKGDGDSVIEEAPIQIQRKTKWGPDLSVDTNVRKGRALAYQIRIDQISQQLTIGSIEIEDNQDPLSTSWDHQLSTEKSEELELERREIIGELLKLNPSYKAPTNYKPILKEAKVPIPIKEYPGYNFISVIFGPGNDTQKRVEKETGAKVRVYGTKADTGAKVEVTSTDEKETINVYEDLYVHISADTFEKLDAAISLIELLVTPVSANPVSALPTSTAVSDDNVNSQPSQSAFGSTTSPALPRTEFLPPQYPQPWFPAGPPQTTTHPQSGLVTLPISSPTLLSNPIHVSSSPFGPSNVPSFFGPRPVMSTIFTPVPQNPSHSPTYGPRNTPPISLTGLPQNLRPFISISPMGPAQMPQMHAPSSNGVPGPAPIRFQMISSASIPQPANPNSLSAANPRPSSVDFTFQPHHPPYPSASTLAWQGRLPVQHTITPQIQTGHATLAPQSPLTRPMIPILNSSPGHGFQIPHQMNQPRPQISVNFSGNLPRHPTIIGSNIVSFNTRPHMQPRNFIPPHHPFNNISGPFPPRPENMMRIPQNIPFGGTRPHMFPGPNQPRRPFGSSSGVQQSYDPFSPTSASLNSQKDGNDPEYEDLMASVGVK